MAFRALHLLLLPAGITVNVKERWLRAQYTNYSKTQPAVGTLLIFPVYLGLTSRTAYVDWRVLPAVRAGVILREHEF